MELGDIRTLAQRRIFFGHQSVGQNIIDAIAKLNTAHGWGLRLVESSDPATLTQPAFAHARIGCNRDPRSKITHFVELLAGGLAPALDIALCKLCYIDIDANTDVEALFAYYADLMTPLHDRYPALTLLHVTVPLTAAPSRLDRLRQRWLGRPLPRQRDNGARERFNDLLRRHVASHALFDLADIESGGANAEGRALSRAYTNDGGHLSDKGARTVAIALIARLAVLSTHTDTGRTAARA